MDAVVECVVEVLVVEAPDDGIVFDTTSVHGKDITAEAAYVGVRVTFGADLGGMVVRMQVDVGFGDAVVPRPQWVVYPELLDLGAPRVLGYPPEATLAEKLHAVCTRGLVNSRMKDYYDFWTAHRMGVTTPESLGRAILHTFATRGAALPDGPPEGLTAAFATDPSKRAQWSAFVRKSKLAAPSLTEVVEVAAALAMPAFGVARARRGEG